MTNNQHIDKGKDMACSTLCIKKIIFQVVLMIFIFTGFSHARTTRIELNVNSDDVEGKVSSDYSLDEATLTAGIGATYIQDNFTLANVGLGLSDNLFSPALSLGLGFNGVIGKAEKGRNEYDLGVLGFTIFGEYDFREITSYIPLSITVSLTAAPDPLCFMDTQEYLEFNAGICFYIVRSSAIYVGYKKIKAEFEEGNSTVKKSDDFCFFGFRLTF